MSLSYKALGITFYFLSCTLPIWFGSTVYNILGVILVPCGLRFLSTI